MRRIRCFIFKYGLIWIGWILKQNSSPEIFYYDNKPTTNITAEENIEYFTLGFTKNSVMNRTIRYVKRNATKEATV